MKKLILTTVIGIMALGASAQSGYPYSPVPFTSVKVNDSFWGQRLEASRSVTIPLAFSKCEETGRYKNFEAAAKCLQTGDTTTVTGLAFDDTDVYKTIEGASYILQTYPDKKLAAYVDSVLTIVAAAQEPDGYLYTSRTMNPQHPHEWSGPKRWIHDEDLSHELYNLGHMVEGAVAHYTATGKRNFLDIAIKYADCVCREIGENEGQVVVVPGHQIAEMALAKLYVCTGDKKYLDEAKLFIDRRGDKTRNDEYSKYATLKLQQKWENEFGIMSMPDNVWDCVNPDGTWIAEKVEAQKKELEERMEQMKANRPEGAPEFDARAMRRMSRKYFTDERIDEDMKYCQSHLPIVEQKEAVGHAVRAGYMYTGIADVAALTGEKKYIDAIDTIWDNVVSKKLYITGGIGATNNGEAFGENYELPNMSAYCETCAAIANVYWNYRLFLLHGDAKYIDVLERTLYNGLISGISLDGGGFFYPNPLESMGQHQRRAWFGCACCPSNVCRFIPSLPGYIYAAHENNVYVNLFVGGDANIKLGKKTVKLSQSTSYPWNGNVDITVGTTGKFGVKVRIPGWAQNQVVPSDLYKYADGKRPSYSITVNGQEVSKDLENGYVTMERNWKKGDKISLNLTMTPRLVRANDNVAADKGRVAIENGPVVYCAEWPDNEGFKVRNVLLNQKPKFDVEYKENYILDKYGMNVITTDVQTIGYDVNGNLETSLKKIKLIPYYAWAHRGPGEMLVWLPQDLSAVSATPAPSIASQAKVTGSTERALSAVNDRVKPRSARDASASYCRWSEGEGGGTEWLAYSFARAEDISSCTLYWHDDQPWGGCAVPKSWKIYYKNSAGEWVPVKNVTEYPIAKRVACKVEFEQVNTTAVKLEIEQADGKFAGIYEWDVE